MGTRKDLIGQTFNRWTVLKFSEYRNEKTWWLCRCVCGTVKEVEAQNITSGHVKSCGCLNAESVISRNKARSLALGKASFNTLYYKYKVTAKRRSLEFALTEQEFAELTKGNCKYCNAPPQQLSTNGTRTSAYIYNGVDRKTMT